MAKTIELKVTRIGNSRGVRLPAKILRRYQIKDTLILEERPDEIALRPGKRPKMSWEQTAKAMAAANEDWSPWDVATSDGLNERLGSQIQALPPSEAAALRRLLADMYGET